MPVLIAVSLLKTGRQSILLATTSWSDSSHSAGNATASTTALMVAFTCIKY
jgi:hypothetical protein